MSDEPRLTDAERSILLERYDAMSADPRRAGVVSRFHDALIAYQDGIVGELRARRAAPQAGSCGTALRQLHDAVMKIWGDPEDCDSCSALGDVGEHNPCALHGSSALYDAVMVSRGVLGPCVCGHTVRQHEDVDTTRCRECRCHAFKCPPQPTERPSTGEEPR